MITKKFCNKKVVKKCILLDNEILVFIFENNNCIYFLCNNNKKDNPYEIICYKTASIIRDIIPLKENKYILLNSLNNLEIYNFKEKPIYLTDKENEEFKNINYVIVDKFDSNNFFIIENNNFQMKIKYCNKDIFDNYNIHLIFSDCKNFNLQYLFEDINEDIIDSEIKDEDKKLLKKLFVESDNQSKQTLLIKANNSLLNIIDNKIKNYII